ncbi:exopolyphosphatase [Bacillus solitudinis]|uniref:exopolyphosphatase n=1 Tax=Bacillus solitudinis TaxID=2014074 RepID=UPI000C2397B5|nr:exopolyphosphatase [Bacillus solitudinis]
MNQKRFAIIDIGSNSVRLVINFIDSNGCYKELYNFKTVARLSSHINNQGQLTPKGRDIIVETLHRFKHVITYHRVRDVMAVATAAFRKASNQKEILEHIKRKVGFSIRVLSEKEEAFYGYLAIVNSMSIKNGITVDIGGGSTEITLFKNRELLHYHSFPFGAITLQNQFIQGEQPTEEEMMMLEKFIIGEIRTLSWLTSHEEYPVIGIGGSARNLSLIHQRKLDYPLAGMHQYEIPTADLKEINEQLKVSSFEERQNIDGLSKDRADIIIPASQVITSLTELVGTNSFIMSRKGLRDGLFYEKLLQPMETNRFPNVVEESFYQLSHNYEVSLSQVNHISLLASQLYEQFKSACRIEHSPEEAKHLLKSSARVLYIGEFINNEASSQNTFYLLTNMTIEGISHEERLAIAFISSFRSKNQLQQNALPFSKLLKKKQLKFYEFLGAIMKIAYSLDYSRRKVISGIGQAKQCGDEWIIPFYVQEDSHFEELQTLRHKKHLEKAIKCPIQFSFKKIQPSKHKILT